MILMRLLLEEVAVGVVVVLAWMIAVMVTIIIIDFSIIFATCQAMPRHR